MRSASLQFSVNQEANGNHKNTRQNAHRKICKHTSSTKTKQTSPVFDSPPLPLPIKNIVLHHRSCETCQFVYMTKNLKYTGSVYTVLFLRYAVWINYTSTKSILT